MPEILKKLVTSRKWKLYSRSFPIFLVLAVILFGSALQYSFSERLEPEEALISFLMPEVQEVSQKDEQIPVFQEQGSTQDGVNDFSRSAAFKTSNIDLAVRWFENDKIRDPP